VAVDGGADAILDEGFTPDMVVGDMDSAGEAALRCGAELVVHAYPDGRAPGREALETLRLSHKLVPAPGTSQDVAMLIAAEKGAELIVSVGSHFNLVEFLDKNRRGMSSTFLTRLRVGEILVDAKGVSRLYKPRPGSSPLLLVLGTGLLTLLAVIMTTPGLRDVANLLWLKLRLLLGMDL
ncbi:MAG: putative cytokinetic ring protein SteA, partial [Solirubrobacteraceae bacterium]